MAIQYYKTSYFDQDDKAELTSKFKLGYNVGVFAIAPLRYDYALVAELGYSRKGKKTVVKAAKYTNTASFSLIESSILLRKSFEADLFEDVPSKWFINIGPNVQYWLSGKGNLNTTVPVDYKIAFGPKDNREESTLFVQNSNRILFGLDFGIGFKIEADRSNTNRSISAELRYTRGHTFLGERETNTFSPDFLLAQESMQTSYRVISIVVGYNFEFNYHDTKKGKSISEKVRRRKK